LVEFQLDARLAVVAGDGPLANVVFRLMEWAEAHGWMRWSTARARRIRTTWNCRRSSRPSSKRATRGRSTRRCGSSPSRSGSPRRAVPVRIPACVRAAAAPPPPALRVNTWKEGAP